MTEPYTMYSSKAASQGRIKSDLCNGVGQSYRDLDGSCKIVGLDKPAVSVKELTSLIPISRTTIYEFMKSGDLKATKCGRRTLFLAADIADFLSRLQNGEVGR
ncbi:hypothetical protein AEJ54_15525 [Azospirillum sp. Sp 7]|nr:hypothetical protein AMK58_01745 [Azospirillum brasilense]PWC92592.1 hypothetical protein AEJ54_15525 [Azospirillum sp. Sp 7]